MCFSACADWRRNAGGPRRGPFPRREDICLRPPACSPHFPALSCRDQGLSCAESGAESSQGRKATVMNEDLNQKNLSKQTVNICWTSRSSASVLNVAPWSFPAAAQTVPPVCLCWCGSRAARCTRCISAALYPCRCWRTGTDGWCCWRWWGRSHSRTERSARTPSSSDQTYAWWRSPMAGKTTQRSTASFNKTFLNIGFII